MLLDGVDQPLAQVGRRDGLLGDLAQGDDRVLVVVALDRQRGAGRDRARAMGGKENELEAIGDLVDAVFDGDACHEGCALV